MEQNNLYSNGNNGSNVNVFTRDDWCYIMAEEQMRCPHCGRMTTLYERECAFCEQDISKQRDEHERKERGGPCFIATAVYGTPFAKEIDVDSQVKTREIIIPGYVAQISGELEESMPGWKVLVGPQEAGDIESYVKTLS